MASSGARPSENRIGGGCNASRPTCGLGIDLPGYQRGPPWWRVGMGQREIIPCGSGVERVHLFFFQNAFLRVSCGPARGRGPPHKRQISNHKCARRDALTRSVTLNPRRPRAAFHPFLRAVAGSRVPRLPRSRARGSWLGLRLFVSCVCAGPVTRFLTG